MERAGGIGRHGLGWQAGRGQKRGKAEWPADRDRAAHRAARRAARVLGAPRGRGGLAPGVAGVGWVPAQGLS